MSLKITRTNKPVAEFRPGIDTINVEWATSVDGWLVLYFSYDGGDNWLTWSARLRPGFETIYVSGTTFAFTAPPGRSTPCARVRVEIYDTDTKDNLLLTDDSESFTISLWPDSYVKTVFPENITMTEITSLSPVIVGLGDARLLPNGYLVKIDDENKLDRLFPAPTSVAKAWRILKKGYRGSVFCMRAGDYNEWLSLNPPSPLSFRYIYEALAIAYDGLSRVNCGVVVPVDAIVDLSEFGIGNAFAGQLAQFCLEQNTYMAPVVGVIAATTAKRCKEINAEYNIKDIPAGSICPVNLGSIRGGQYAFWGGVIVNEVTFGGVAAGTPSGMGLLSYDAGARTMTWSEPGSTAGPVTPIPVGQIDIPAASGRWITLKISRLPASNFDVDVVIGWSDVHDGAKYVYPIYGYTTLTYNSSVTNISGREETSLAAAAAATLAGQAENSDPINKAMIGLEATTPVLYESLVKLLEFGGVNSTRLTVSKGYTLATGASAHPKMQKPGTDPNSMDSYVNGWSKMKYVRQLNLLTRAIRNDTRPLIGQLGVQMSHLKGVATLAVQQYEGVVYEWISIDAVRSGMYSADILLAFRPIGSLEVLNTTIGVGI